MVEWVRGPLVSQGRPARLGQRPPLRGLVRTAHGMAMNVKLGAMAALAGLEGCVL